jgi:alkaline phosphatase
MVLENLLMRTQSALALVMTFAAFAAIPAGVLAQATKVTAPEVAQTLSIAPLKADNTDQVKGAAALTEALKRQPIDKPARNIILFIGDGMGINSVTAGRIFTGQTKGVDGASYRLTFEGLPYTAFSKTYSTSSLVTDSANGISAITTGIKTINGGIGVDGNVKAGSCDGVEAARIRTVAETAKLQGRAAGFVTTSGITDATPAGTYGHTSTRGWRAKAPEGCVDLARQLVEAPKSIRMDVAMGGDREKFLPQDKPDSKDAQRVDGRDLTKAWKKDGGLYVTDTAGLTALDAKSGKPVLGLFSVGDLPSPVDTDKHKGVPGLDEMTGRAIDILSQNPNGFFLLVESASIDKWHHRNNAYRALTDVDELDKAVKVALEKTNAEDTLIIVTADHSHGLVESGYPKRDAPIMGLVTGTSGADEEDTAPPMTILSYATGPGGVKPGEASRTLTQDEATKPDFLQPALTKLGSAAHGGEDVPVYSRGPQAYLLSSTVESSFIYQVMLRALTMKTDAKPAQ